MIEQRGGRRSRALLAIGSSALVLLGVVATEWLARICAPDYLVRTRGLHVFSDTLGWMSRRGASTTMAGHRVTINARGYRGRELAAPRPDDRTRLVVLGDSIAFGLDVSDGQTFTDLLDTRHNGIEAANMAVQGYGPGQELLLLQHDGLPLSPDVVVLAFCLDNDFADALIAVSLYDGRAPKPRFLLEGDRLVLDDSGVRQTSARAALQWLGDYSHVFNRMSALASRRELAVPHWRYRRRQAHRDEGYALRLSVALIERMNTLCRENDIAFLVAVFPNQKSYRMKSSLAVHFLESLQRRRITVVDLTARFAERGLRFNEIALDGIGHLSPRGHFVASQVLEAEVAARLAQKPGAMADTRLR